jgi:serine/threonine-protein kinase
MNVETETMESRQTTSSRWGFVLMVSILIVASILSALTAMRFAIRGREVVVPAVVGKTQAEAQKLLEDRGLVLKVSSKRFSADVPEGRVVDQIPATGTHLKTNRSVKVLVSLGDRKYAVPNLIGTSLRAAQLTLAQRRLALGNTLYAHTPEGEPSTVVYQSPSPGSQEGSDPSVQILISLGPTEQYFTMPDLIGQPAELVASKAKAEGFKVAKPTYRKYPGVGPGLVIQQKPQAGYRITKSDVIVLDVSQ